MAKKNKRRVNTALKSALGSPPKPKSKKGPKIRHLLTGVGENSESPTVTRARQKLEDAKVAAERAEAKARRNAAHQITRQMRLAEKHERQLAAAQKRYAAFMVRTAKNAEKAMAIVEKANSAGTALTPKQRAFVTATERHVKAAESFEAYLKAEPAMVTARKKRSAASACKRCSTSRPATSSGKKSSKKTSKKSSKKTSKKVGKKTAKKSTRLPKDRAIDENFTLTFSPKKSYPKKGSRKRVADLAAEIKSKGSITLDDIKSLSRNYKAKSWICGGPVRTGCGGGKNKGHLVRVINEGE